jgi:hypothetical protein
LNQGRIFHRMLQGTQRNLTANFEAKSHGYYFLKERTKFIRFYYGQCVEPFTRIKDQIENGQPPFDDPPYSEDPEPPYLAEWMDAETGIQIVGLSCVSLLSDSLKLYFGSLQHHVIGFDFPNKESEKAAFKNGFLAAYTGILGSILDTDWVDCPVDLEIIEQVILARNRGQHGGHLTSFRVSHDERTLTKHPRPFFASDQERESWIEGEGTAVSSFLAPNVTITREALFAAVDQVEKLAEWIEGRMDKATDWRMGRRH